MPTTDTTEKGLEALIVDSLVDDKAGYIQGDPPDYDRDHAIDLAKFVTFLSTTQPKVLEQISLAEDGPKRAAFLARLQAKSPSAALSMSCVTGSSTVPHRSNSSTARLLQAISKPLNDFAANIFSVTRQLRYSKDETQLALDLCIFINGLPVATFELKNRLTKQTVEDAVQQYKRDRDPRELLFQFGRCMVHLARGRSGSAVLHSVEWQGLMVSSVQQGLQRRAGNPPNPEGIKTDYLWRAMLTRTGLTEIIENYAQIIEEKDERSGARSASRFFLAFISSMSCANSLVTHAIMEQDGVILSSIPQAAVRVTLSPGLHINCRVGEGEPRSLRLRCSSDRPKGARQAN